MRYADNTPTHTILTYQLAHFRAIVLPHPVEVQP